MSNHTSDLYRITVQYTSQPILKDGMPEVKAEIPEVFEADEHFTASGHTVALLVAQKFTKNRLDALEHAEKESLDVTLVFLRQVTYGPADMNGYICSPAKSFVWKWLGESMDRFNHSIVLEIQKRLETK